jgi:hypothetical protein
MKSEIRKTLIQKLNDPKFGSWELKVGVEVACGMVDGLKIPA